MTLEKAIPCTPCGQHWIIELSGCSFSVLNNKEAITKAIDAVCTVGNFTCLEHAEHSFLPHGITMFYILSESHISIHTWPEHGYAAIDIFTCGKPPLKESIVNTLQEHLSPLHCDIQTIKRGFRS